jgi:hypothetical protein
MNAIGKSIYIWQIEGCFNGDLKKIVDALKVGNFQSVILHSTNVNNWRTTLRISLVKALQTAGIAVFGGCAIYGADSYGEGDQTGQICKDLNLSGWIWDAETAFDNCDHPDSAAVHVLQEFISHAQPGALKGWCWWCFPHAVNRPTTEYHPIKILRAAMMYADVGLPMMYWSWGDDAINAVRYLDESWKQWGEITQKPIVPIGRAYIGDEGTATPEAVIAFEAQARILGAIGISWWSMQHAINIGGLPGVWNALLKMQTFGNSIPPDPTPVPVQLSTEEELNRLVKAHPNIFPELNP